MERIVELPRRFDAAYAQRLVGTLREHRGTPLRFDAGEVESISALGLEVIVSAAIQWQSDGFPVSISNQSKRFAATCRTLGLRADRPWEPLAEEEA